MGHFRCSVSPGGRALSYSGAFDGSVIQFSLKALPLPFNDKVIGKDGKFVLTIPKEDRQNRDSRSKETTVTGTIRLI